MHHGEYKEPGGKLIQVDFSVEGGRLTHVKVSGDFFLYPDEALEAIVASVEGSAVGLSPTERTDRIATALGPDVEWLGSSPAGLSTAIQRALEAGGAS